MPGVSTPNCVLLERLIAQTKSDMEGLRETIRRQRGHIDKLMAQQPPNPALIQEAKEILSRLERNLEDDRIQLQAMEDEYAADCRL
jgi:hypothetical protein